MKILVTGGAGFYSTARRVGIRASAPCEPAPLGAGAPLAPRGRPSMAYETRAIVEEIGE